jgi:hypothetical protein
MAVTAESVNVQSVEKPSKFETKDDLSDITLIVEDKKLYVHKTMLGYSSPVFRQMFTADLKEKNAEEVPLPGKKYQAFVNFLHQIYPGPMASTPIDGNYVLLFLSLRCFCSFF